MEHTLRQRLAEQGLGGLGRPSRNRRHDAQPGARAGPGGSPTVLNVGGHEVRVLLTLRHPRVVLFGNFLSDAECDELMALAAPRLARSETVDNNTGGSEVNAARTSDGMFFERGEHPLIQPHRSAHCRVAALAGGTRRRPADPALPARRRISPAP
jgi:prolyl 4-hydroxylase